MKRIAPHTLLALGFLALILLMAAMVMLGATRLVTLGSAFERVVGTNNIHGTLAQEMRRASRERSMLLHAMTVTDDPFARDDYFLEMRDLGARFLEARERLTAMELTPRERTLLEQQRALSTIAGPLQYQVIDLLAEGRLREARRVLLEEAIPAQDKALRMIDSFVALQQARSATLLEESLDEVQGARNRLLLLGALALLIGLGVALFITHRAGSMLRALGESNRRLEEANEALSNSREELEQRVADRTRELHRANDQLRQEIAEKEEAIERARYLANHERVSGLPNRTLFAESMKLIVARARRRSHPAALLRIDLDRFREINERYGTECGDRLLKAVGERLRAAVRGEDVAAHLGGDEFALMLSGLSDAGDAELVADQVLEDLAEPYELGGQRRRLTSSIGIAVYPDDSIDGEELTRLADAAMQQAKASGGNGRRRWIAQSHAGEPSPQITE